MKRTHAILLLALRDSPLAIMGLLTVGWFFSQFHLFGWQWVGASRRDAVFFRCGSIRLVSTDTMGERSGFHSQSWNASDSEFWGEFEVEIFAWTDSPTYAPIQEVSVVMIPIPWILTLLLPAAVGPFFRYRFPLWTWFAWVAIIAAETAWYCRTFEGSGAGSTGLP